MQHSDGSALCRQRRGLPLRGVRDDGVDDGVTLRRFRRAILHRILHPLPRAQIRRVSPPEILPPDRTPAHPRAAATTTLPATAHLPYQPTTAEGKAGAQQRGSAGAITAGRGGEG
jgi:hypothetical protein